MSLLHWGRGVIGTTEKRTCRDNNSWAIFRGVISLSLLFKNDENSSESKAILF